MKAFRLIIAGGRDFDDFKKLCMVCDHMLSRVIEEGYKITAVSYTHLDVYKRQYRG